MVTTRSSVTLPLRSTAWVAMPSESRVSRSAWVNRSVSAAGRMPVSSSVWNGRAGSAAADCATRPAMAPAHSGIEVGDVLMPMTVEYGLFRALP